MAVKWRGSLEEGICTACGESEMVYSNRGWCRACDMRWYSAGQPEGGPPPLKQARNGRRVRRCSQCGVVARIWGRELCQDCYLRYRQPIAYKQRVEQMEKLSLKRILWAIEKPGEPNPFQCVAPGCTETGDPFTYHLCRVHYRRLCIYGTYELPGEPRPAA